MSLPAFTRKRTGHRSPSIACSHLRMAGFTLTELLVVIAISAILATSIAPFALSVVDEIRIRGYTNQFMSDLALARSEAIKRNSRVTLCKSENGVGCASSGGWQQGWIIFHDQNGNGTADAGEPVIRQMSALAQGFNLTGNMPVSRYITYAATGTTQLTSGAFQAGTVTICRASSSAVNARIIVINSAGRPRTRKQPLSDCQ